jgi:NSS family neurotransmitter:Na+ symporter
MKEKSQSWSSYLGFILASVGSAVGLGNVWRYPYYLKDYGIFFLIFSFLFLLLFGIPFLFFEMAAGKVKKKNFKDLLTSFHHPLISYIPFLCLILIMGYYAVVDGWTLGMSLASLFHTPFSEVKTTLSPIITLLIFILLYFIVKRDVSKGIEVVDKIGVSFLTLFLFLFLIFALSSVPVSKILVQLNKPFNFAIPAYALAQIFFSLSVGSGILYTYSMYDKAKGDELKSSFLVALADFATSVVAGIVVVAFLMMSNVGGGVESLFFAVPNALASLPFSNAIVSIFFLLLFIAGFTSLCSMVEPLLSTDIFGKGNREEKALRMLFFVLPLAFFISLAPTLTRYFPFFSDLVEKVDHFSSFLLLVSSLIFVLAVVWKGSGEFEAVFGKGSVEMWLIRYCKVAIPTGVLLLIILSLM